MSRGIQIKIKRLESALESGLHLKGDTVATIERLQGMLDRIGIDGEIGFEASTRLYIACCESLSWWDDSFASVGYDGPRIESQIKKAHGDDTVRVVRKLRRAVDSATEPDYSAPVELVEPAIPTLQNPPASMAA